MSRTELTKMLSDLVRKRLNNKSLFWAEEVNLDYYQKRVDFVGFRPAKNGSFANVADIEKGSFDFYEVKSSMEDFNSGHGKNWEGDKNFLVCTKELADKLKYKMILPSNVTVLCPNKNMTSLIKVYDTHWSSRRKKSASEILWAMVCSRISNKVDNLEAEE